MTNIVLEYSMCVSFQEFSCGTGSAIYLYAFLAMSTSLLSVPDSIVHYFLQFNQRFHSPSTHARKDIIKIFGFDF